MAYESSFLLSLIYTNERQTTRTWLMKESFLNQMWGTVWPWTLCQCRGRTSKHKEHQPLNASPHGATCPPSLRMCNKRQNIPVHKPRLRANVGNVQGTGQWTGKCPARVIYLSFIFIDLLDLLVACYPKGSFVYFLHFYATFPSKELNVTQ